MNSVAIAPAALRERPILFSGPMVRAILEGRKTQTRRVVRDQASISDVAGGGIEPVIWWPRSGDDLRPCPYGDLGDRLWVREAHRFAESGSFSSESVHYRADPDEVAGGPWRPSIHMHRWASRITLELTAVRVQRLQEISEEDAQAEGSCVRHAGKPCPPMTYDGLPSTPPWPRGPRICFGSAWTLLNAERGYPWSSDPWVWVLAFKRLA